MILGIKDEGVFPEIDIRLKLLASGDWIAVLDVEEGLLLNCTAPCSEAIERLTQAAFPHPNGNEVVLDDPVLAAAEPVSAVARRVVDDDDDTLMLL